MKFWEQKDEAITRAINDETPAAEQALMELARELGFEEVELFSGEILSLKEPQN